ncbi:tetratricopeptide repeat protein [Tamlana sp. I1]|uniref:tetratricopeptide repeat protein n=1 Tax=Tamlana sp. I1 TaxID=2762061 RepID=UPI00188E146D|nr:tetratricopeptide repeat protein [Tamlana sp. I1]
MNKILWFLLLPLLGFSQDYFPEIDSLFKAKNYQKAEVLLVQYLENHQNNIKAKALLGDAYGYQKQWDKSIAIYKNLVAEDENNADYHYKYGAVLTMKALQNKLKAMAYIGDIKSSFLRAAQLDKNHIDTRWALVKMYMLLPGILGGSQTKALYYSDELEALSPIDGYLTKGYIYEYDDEPELAETYYKKAVKTGGSVYSYAQLTNFYDKQNKPEKAISYLELAQQQHQNNKFNYEIGKIAALHHVQMEKGIQCLEAYIKNHTPKDELSKAWAAYRLAQIYRQKRDRKSALEYIDLALSEDPETAVFKTEKEAILSL